MCLAVGWERVGGDECSRVDIARLASNTAVPIVDVDGFPAEIRTRYSRKGPPCRQ